VVAASLVDGDGVAAIDGIVADVDAVAVNVGCACARDVDDAIMDVGVVAAAVEGGSGRVDAPDTVDDACSLCGTGSGACVIDVGDESDVVAVNGVGSDSGVGSSA